MVTSAITFGISTIPTGSPCDDIEISSYCILHDGIVSYFGGVGWDSCGNIRSPVTTHNNYAWCIYVDGDVDFSYYGTEWNSCGALRILQVLVTEVLI